MAEIRTCCACRPRRDAILVTRDGGRQGPGRRLSRTMRQTGMPSISSGLRTMAQRLSRRMQVGLLSTPKGYLLNNRAQRSRHVEIIAALPPPFRPCDRAVGNSGSYVDADRTRSADARSARTASTAVAELHRNSGRRLGSADPKLLDLDPLRSGNARINSRRLQQPGHRLRQQRRPRPRHRRFQRGDPARSQRRRRLQQPRSSLRRPRATTTAPSPTWTEAIRLDPKSAAPITTAAGPARSSAATSPRRSPTATSRCGFPPTTPV